MNSLRNINNCNRKKKCYSILDNLKNISKDEIIDISIDQDLILTFLEISLYPNEKVINETEYSILATDLICTNVVLEILINLCFFDSDSSSYISSVSDSTSDSCGNSDSSSNNQEEINRAYALPLSVLIVFITDYSNKETKFRDSYMGMFHFCKIVYSLMLFDLDWTWIFLLSINQGYIILKLINLINHPSIIHLLKLITSIICECESNNKFGTYNMDSCNTLLKTNSSIISSYMLVEFLFSNLKIINEYEHELDLFNIEKEILIIRTTSNFIIEILQDTLDKKEIVSHFSFKNLRFSATPLSIDSKFKRWLLNYETNRKKWPVYYNIITNISSKNNICKLLDNILTSIKKLDFNLNNINYKEFSYYTNSFTSSLSILTTILNYELNSEIKKKLFSQEFTFGSKQITKFSIFNNSKALNTLKSIIPSKYKKNNNISNLRIISNVVIPITKEYLWDFAKKLYFTDESIVNKTLIISIITEFLNYVKILICTDDTSYVKRLLSETNNETNIPVICELFNLIIFNDINYSIIQESLQKIFEICIDDLKEKKLIYIDNKNIEFNSKVYFIFEYTNSSFIKSILQFEQNKQIKKQEWIDDRMLRREMENEQNNNRLGNHSNILLPYSGNRQFDLYLTKRNKIPNLAYYLLNELYTLQNDIFWIKNLFKKSKIFISENLM